MFSNVSRMLLRAFTRTFAVAALAGACLLATAADASACGNRKGLFGRWRDGGSGSCGSGFGFASRSGSPAACGPQSCPAAPSSFATNPTALPGLPGVPPQFLPDGTRAYPLPSPVVPTDLVPAFVTDPVTGKSRHIGWVRGKQFIPLQP